MKINNLPGIRTSTEIDAPLPDDSSESVTLMKLSNLALMKPNLNIIRQDNVEFWYCCFKHLTWADNIISIECIYRLEIGASFFYQCQIPLSFEVECLQDIEGKRL